MDEGRKRTILIAARILVARKLGQLEAQPTPTLDNAIAEAIWLAERIMQKIDASTAATPTQHMTSNAEYLWKGGT